MSQSSMVSHCKYLISYIRIIFRRGHIQNCRGLFILRRIFCQPEQDTPKVLPLFLGECFTVGVGVGGIVSGVANCPDQCQSLHCARVILLILLLAAKYRKFQMRSHTFAFKLQTAEIFLLVGGIIANYTSLHHKESHPGNA